MLVHPNMGKRYREKVTDLANSLNDENHKAEAVEIIRSLVDRIVLSPDPDSDKGLTIDLEGDLAGILNLCTNSKKALTLSDEDLKQIKLVAGVGFGQSRKMLKIVCY